MICNDSWELSGSLLRAVSRWVILNNSWELSGGLLRAVSKGSSCFSFFCSSLFRSSFFSLLSFVLAYFHLNLDVVMLHGHLLLKVDVLSVLCKVRFLDFSRNVDFWNFPVGFGVWEGLQ